MSSARFAKDSRNAECSGGGEGDAGQQQDDRNGDQKKVIARYTFGKRWHRFRVLTPRMFILRGSRAMNDLRFKYRSRGRQGAPCSVMAVVYGRLFQPKEWTSDYVDQVLEHGDKLFRTSAMKCRLKDEEYLKTNLVHKEIYVGLYKILIDIEDSGIRGNLFGTATGCSDLAEGLRQFLREDVSGVITAQATSVAVWRQSGDTLSFLYYDPAACDDAGVHRSGGTACLIRFKCLDDLHDHLLKNLDRRYDSRYCIDKVTVLRVMEVNDTDKPGRRVSRSENLFLRINHGLELASFGDALYGIRFTRFKNSETSGIPRALREGESIHKLSEIDRP